MSADPISVLTGFLGSGKTTLLRRLLADPAMAETAVVVNELGEVGLDHLLVREITEDIVLLNSGCLCCTVRDDLVESLLELHRERAAGRVPHFRRVAIETTGLADPAPIIHTLITDAELVPRFRLGTVVTTVDATLGDAQLDRHAEAVKQAAMADRLVITKSDLGPDRVAAVAERLRALNPGASILTATLDHGPGPEALLDAGPLDQRAKSGDVARWLNAEAYAAARPHDHHGRAERHDARFAAFCLTLDRPVEWAPFVEWLEALLASRGEDLLRVKGMLDVVGRPAPVIIHGVQHVFYPPTELAAWPDAYRRSRLVFITRDLPGAGIERSLASVLGVQALAAERLAAAAPPP